MGIGDWGCELQSHPRTVFSVTWQASMQRWMKTCAGVGEGLEFLASSYLSLSVIFFVIVLWFSS